MRFSLTVGISYPLISVWSLMMMHLHDESVNLIQLVVTALKRRGWGTGTQENRGQERAGSGNRN